MAKLTPAEANRRRLKVHSKNFDLEKLGIRDLRKIVRAGLALCERVELCGEPDVKSDKLYVTRNEDGSFSYEYHYTHKSAPLQDKYLQSTLDRLARKYSIKV